MVFYTNPCDSYHKFSNICKPEEGWYGQPKYCYEKTIHVVLISFAVVFGLLVCGSETSLGPRHPKRIGRAQ